jgi:hypothetical protein
LPHRDRRASKGVFGRALAVVETNSDYGCACVVKLKLFFFLNDVLPNGSLKLKLF